MGSSHMALCSHEFFGRANDRHAVGTESAGSGGRGHRDGLLRMLPKEAAGEANRFRDRLFINASVALLDESAPRHALGHQLQHIGHQDACANEGRFPVTDLWIRDHVAPEYLPSFVCHRTFPSPYLEYTRLSDSRPPLRPAVLCRQAVREL